MNENDIFIIFSNASSKCQESYNLRLNVFLTAISFFYLCSKRQTKVKSKVLIGLIRGHEFIIGFDCSTGFLRLSAIVDCVFVCVYNRMSLGLNDRKGVFIHFHPNLTKQEMRCLFIHINKKPTANQIIGIPFNFFSRCNVDNFSFLVRFYSSLYLYCLLTYFYRA